MAFALVGSTTLTVNSYGPTITTITGDLSWTDKTMIGARLAGCHYLLIGSWKQDTDN